MIETTNLAKIRMLNFYQAMEDVQKFLNQEDLETLKLKEPAKAFGDKFAAFDSAIQPLRQSGLSKSLLELDSQRDRALSRIATHFRLFSDYPDGTKAAAAQQLARILKKYDSRPGSKPLREETALITNLLQDFDAAEAKAALTLLGADKWVEILKDANTKFNAPYGQLVQHDAAIEQGATKAKRIALYEEFRRLSNIINALATLNGEAAYKRLIDNINTEVKKAILAERPDMKKKTPDDKPKAPKDPKQPEGPKKPEEPKKPEDPKKPNDPKKPGEEKPEDPKKPKPDDGDDDIHLPEE